MAVVQNFVSVDQEAEVVGIQEDVHPHEFVTRGTEAELVGTDYVYGVASYAAHTKASTEAVRAVEEATILTGQGNIGKAFASPVVANHSLGSAVAEAIVDQQAEVVEIQEDVHPDEFVGNSTLAELLGADYSYRAANNEGMVDTKVSVKAIGVVEEAAVLTDQGNAGRVFTSLIVEKPVLSPQSSRAAVLPAVTTPA